MPVADTMDAEEVVEELWREIWREIVPNWDIGMGPKPGPWGTEAEDVATAEEGKEKHTALDSLSCWSTLSTSSCNSAQ